MKKYSSKTRRSSHHSSNNKNFKKLFLWLGIIAILLFGLRPIVSTVSSWITTPFFSISHYIETSSATIPVFIRSREELLENIKSLEQELSSYSGVENSLSSLGEENETLRALLHASSSPRIAAGVIARPPHTPYDVLLIDRGSNDGIKHNAPVYYGKGKVLGYVQKVFNSHSLVTPISSPGIETSVYIFGPDIFVTAYGQGGGVIQLNVPQGISVGIGDLVVTPSLERGILGDIESVESNPTEPEQHAYVTYDQSIQSIRLVSVGSEPLATISYDAAKAAITDIENQFLQFEIPDTPTVNDEIDTSTSTEPDIDESS